MDYYKLFSTRVDTASGALPDAPRSAEPAGCATAAGDPGASPSAATNSARTPDPLDDPRALREQNRRLCDLLTEEAAALHAVRELALDYSSRAGAQIDAATVAASLWPILAGLPLPPRPCPACLARRVAVQRQTEMLLGLAGLRRVEVGE